MRCSVEFYLWQKLSMSAKSLLVFVAVIQILGAAKQAGSEIKICQGIRAGGSNSAFRRLRPRFLVGRIKLKREKKIRTGNHIRRRLHKIWLNIVNKQKSKKLIKKQKKVSKMKRDDERRRGKYILASVKQQQKDGTKHKKLGKRKKEKLQRKLKRKKYNQRRQKQKLSKIIHIHIRQPSRMRIFRSKQRKRIKTKQRGKSQRGAVTLFLEK